MLFSELTQLTFTICFFKPFVVLVFALLIFFLSMDKIAEDAG